MRLLTRNNFFDDAFESLFAPISTSNSTMKTDIIESEKDFTLEIDMAGAKKEEISINFEQGYLTISGKTTQQEDVNYIRRERNTSCSRTYYVGDIDKNSIKAKYENGVLSVVILKEEKLPESTNILID